MKRKSKRHSGGRIARRVLAYSYNFPHFIMPHSLFQQMIQEINITINTLVAFFASLHGRSFATLAAFA